MLIFLDCWPTFVCLLLSGPFPINTTSTSKAPTTLPGFLPSKSLCCHGNLMFSWEPNQQHPLIASMKVVQTPIPLRYRSYPVISIPIFTCYNTLYEIKSDNSEQRLFKKLHPERVREDYG